jgi:hypothetical protein
MSERNVKEFAVGTAALLSGGTLKLIGMVLEKHDAAVIEFCCNQQDKITALEKERDVLRAKVTALAAVPDELLFPASEMDAAYCRGWNDCRRSILLASSNGEDEAAQRQGGEK